MKYSFVFIVTIFMACSYLPSKAVEPTEKKVNILQKGNSITFSFGEVMGIDRSTYPADQYTFDYDTLYFKPMPSKTTNDGSSGGMETTRYEYKTIKKGKTSFIINKKEFTFTRIKDEDGMESTLMNDTSYIDSKYLFIIK